MKTVIVTKNDSVLAEKTANSVKEILQKNQIETISEEKISDTDFVIAIGGDGTILHLAKNAALYNKPVLGINCGRMGYMAGLEADEADLLCCLKSGDYLIDERMLLEVTANVNGNTTTCYALNEAVISRGGAAHILDINISVDRREPICYEADGIIVATPTGSTAYSLSAGGPVLDPEVKGMILTPLCPHGLDSRSVVFSKDKTLQISAKSRSNGQTFLCVDGEKQIEITDGTVEIKRAQDLSVKLIRIKNDPFYKIYKEKIK